jgi:hypothetical protein
MAKLALTHCLFKVLVGSGNDAQINFYRPRAAYTFKLLLLQNTQELCLYGRRQLKLDNTHAALTEFTDDAIMGNSLSDLQAGTPQKEGI